MSLNKISYLLITDMYYSVSEAGFVLGVHGETIRRWDKGGKIKCNHLITKKK